MLSTPVRLVGCAGRDLSFDADGDAGFAAMGLIPRRGGVHLATWTARVPIHQGSTAVHIVKPFVLVALMASAPGFAAGCLSGGAVGGVGGHVVGHHAVAGAVVGCAVGHHMAVKKQRQADAAVARQRAAAASAPVGR